MTTTLQKAIVPNNHLVLTGITWEKFEQIETTFQDIEGIRFIYLDGELEIIMNLGQEHEYYKRTISLLLEAYCREKRVRFYAGGSATLGNKNIIPGFAFIDILLSVRPRRDRGTDFKKML